MHRTRKNWEYVAYAICKQAAHIAFKDKRVVETPEEMKEGDIYINEIGRLWRKNSDNSKHHQVFVSPSYLIKAARIILDAEEMERHIDRIERTIDHTTRGLASSFLSNVKNSWEEVEHAYRSMHSYSRSENSQHDMETLHDLEDYANALKAAADNLQNFVSGHKKKHLKYSKTINYHFCPLCWRHVFKTSSNYSGNERCSVHKDTKSKEYKTALGLKNYVKLEHRISRQAKIRNENVVNPVYTEEDFLPPKYAQIKSDFNIELKAVKDKVDEFERNKFLNMKPTHHSANLTELHYPTASFDLQSIPEQPIDLDDLWEIFEKTAIYAAYHGADLTNLGSVLETLDDKKDPTGMRKKIHTAYIRAPMLALDFLMNVEVWRTLHIEQGFRGKSKKAI